MEAFAECTRAGLAQIPEADRHKAVIMYSAHSLPLSAVERGDPYPHEVAATVYAVNQKLGNLFGLFDFKVFIKVNY